MPEAAPIAARAAAPSGVTDTISVTVSYQMPASALPKSGFSASDAVLATIRSIISPGIWLESNTLVASGSFSISATIGFQVTIAATSCVWKAPTMSGSAVLTTLTSASDSPTVSSARASR